MGNDESSVSVHVKITVDPSKTKDFLSALEVIFEKTKLEPLNTFLEVYRDDKTPGVFKLAENWNTTADYMLNVQIKKDYYQAYYAALQPILLKAPEVEMFSRMPDNEWASVRKECYPR
ncbi:hypothetical protein PG993_013495 [Apiospora rasikravindrae]|uniref:ABM domain-containing protein n=1 Tax=Apiospora rasikravindrae TaxID=990691 RepID=A0ABR1RXW4_9PEZI